MCEGESFWKGIPNVARMKKKVKIARLTCVCMCLIASGEGKKKCLNKEFFCGEESGSFGVKIRKPQKRLRRVKNA